MNIAINARLLIKGNITGVGKYIYEIMCSLSAQYPECKFFCFFDRSYDSDFIVAENIIPVVIKPKVRFHPLFYKFWYDVQVSRQLRRLNIDVFISADGLISTTTKVPTIMVIHDLAFEHYSNLIPYRMMRYLKKYTPLCAKKAAHVIAVSEYTKGDIIERYKIEDNKISVAPSGVVNDFFVPLNKIEKKSVKEKYAQGQDFFLFVGTIHPRKNIKNQILAFDKFREDNPKSKHKFLIVGTVWVWDNDLKQIYDNMQYREDIVFTGYIPTEDLAKLMASAIALMYVSIFEGFGIPIVEAFFTETPVITSNTSSMPEVAGDAAIIVNPNNITEIANAMTKIYVDEGFTKVLLQNARNRKNEFSWKKTSDVFIKSLDEIINNIK